MKHMGGGSGLGRKEIKRNSKAQGHETWQKNFFSKGEDFEVLLS
jgi:hypothetical protein